MKRMTLIRLLSFLGAILLALVGLCIYAFDRMRTYETELDYVYNQSMEDLNTNLDNISVFLTKSLYVGSPAQLSTVAAELFRASGNAKSALAQLPAAAGELQAINRFLSQVGDYSLFLSHKAIGGAQITDEEFESLRTLGQTAKEISEGLHEIGANYASGGNWGGVNEEAAQTGGFGESIYTLEESLTDTPSLIYDGPFSDHILTRTSEMLENANEVSLEEARAVAAELVGVPASALEDDAGEEGKTPAYGFRIGDAVVRVTKNGGYPLYYRKTTVPGVAKFSEEQAVERAKEYAGNLFDGNFVESYYATDEGVCVVNFAHKEGGTLCYTDLIKVGVALDSGEVVLLEARGYLMNHRQRNIPTPKYDLEAAEAVLSPLLTVEKSSLTLIPSDGGAELPCYEFLCSGKEGEELLVYVNTQTCQEERLLILLKTDGGTLTK